MRTPRALILVAVGLSCAQPEKVISQGEVLLYVDTDAPVPSGPGQRASVVTPLFDRLRIDIYAPGETTPCADCTNEFEINGLVLARRTASIGIAPRFDTPGYRARVRLFVKGFTDASGEPNDASTVDVTVAIPPVDATTKLERTAFLSVEDVGRPVGSLAAPAEPRLGAPETSKMGTWPGATRVDCAATPPNGVVCVPGGAFWMGNPNAPGFVPAGYVLQPRLVVVSPFFMSATETTVRQYRRVGAPARTWTGASTGETAGDWCTWTTDPGPWEAYPVNCVSLEEARRYCLAVGGDLPTEAQHEYAQSGLVGNVFPWGRDEPSCSDALYGRAGYGTLAQGLAPCKPLKPPGGLLPPGSGARDRLVVPTGTIVDLAGSVNEWMRDRWNRIDEPCWSSPLLRDPVCTTPSPADGDLAVHRGGNWADISVRMVSSVRFGRPRDGTDPQTGFRCVWPTPAAVTR